MNPEKADTRKTTGQFDLKGSGCLSLHIYQTNE